MFGKSFQRPPVKPALLALAAQAVFMQAALAQQDVQLDVVEVKARGEITNASEVTRSYENPAVSASTGLALTRRETPQSVSTLTRQQMDDENVETLDDALLHATGISATQLDVGVRTTYRARGFAISNFRVDGAKIDGETSFAGSGQSLNMDLYDRVEILRGANGLLGATGDPSGTIDLVRKEARKTRFGAASVTFGSWNKRHLMLDLNQPLTQDGGVRSRLVLSGDDSDGFRDREQDKSLGLLASVTADLSADTRAGLGFQLERRRINGATWGTNVPIWFSDGSTTHFSRSMSASADWSYSLRETRTLFANLEHRIGSNWSTRLTGSIAQGEARNHLAVSKANSGSTATRGFWNQDGTGAYLNTMFQESDNQTRNIQWTVNGNYQFAGRSHQFMAGLNASDSKTTTLGLQCRDAAGVVLASCMNRISSRFAIGDWREFIASGSSIGEVTSTRTGLNTTTRQKTYGGYVANRFKITDPLAVIAGARLGWQSNYANGAVSSSFSHQVTPYLGAVYDLSSHYSLYASYTDVFEAQTQRQTNGDYLSPKTGTAFETGIKGEWLDGQIDGSLAVFYSKQKDLATIARDAEGNPLYVNGNEADGTAYVNGASGVRTRGFELDFSGRITPHWNVYGGYTFLSVDNPNSPTTDNDPRHLFRLNTSYRLPGTWNKLTIGGGLTTQSAMRQAPTGTSHPTLGSNVNIDLKGYTLYHAMARYDINKNLVATLNISNLFDKTYYRQYGFYSGAIYGEPRAFRLTLRASF